MERSMMLHKEAVLKFVDVSFSYPGYQPVLEDFSAELNHGDVVCVIGASGCGKTTLLNLAGGFLMPTGGCVYDTHGEVQKPDKNRVMVFQHTTQLFPWLTAAGNIKFPLSHGSKKSGSVNRTVEELLEAVGLSDAAGLYPSQMSGGMQQRAVIARALSTKPDMLLLDEPFTALDAPTRRSLQQLLVDLNSRMNISMMFVTHDISEAVYIADKLIIMKKEGPVFLDVDIKRRLGKRDEYSDEFVRLGRKVYNLIEPD